MNNKELLKLKGEKLKCIDKSFSSITMYKFYTVEDVILWPLDIVPAFKIKNDLNRISVYNINLFDYKRALRDIKINDVLL